MAVNKYTYLGKRAVELRKQGRSYKEIGAELGVSKGTLSLWLKGVPVPPEYKERLYNARVLSITKGQHCQKERRKREIEKIVTDAKKEIPLPVSDETFKLFGAALYWGEGSKGNRFQVTNSDPRLILFMVHWIEKILRIKRKNLNLRLNIYPQQSELEIKKFWSHLTDIPLQNFGKSFVKPLSTAYRKNNLYYGMIRIEVPKSCDFVHKIYGWTQAILEKENKKAKKSKEDGFG
ncbi:hypothetical protein A2755_01405 [Candidatus Wolfebacteria bacterium RIFCSPHIGHO2_01_FULL_48_22]|uniref:Uncharacterized protein n=2 Tax=Candidatus Wolfeibacteriota TaxID=1752735 RepID=A0A1F8DUX5_9BACT|nr:MAG: hypothetical protein A2755_01405 [Candidatus Wolfebacteria bacterium RIFCSPHIGHO2_01_FULL_48_22]OGM93893.1 MAG: hypothetical protein A2935_03380 [Candidatus Wolfebacteria bacterium RIFCSPLOWO2_01_FULL_47_17b]